MPQVKQAIKELLLFHSKTKTDLSIRKIRVSKNKKNAVWTELITLVTCTVLNIFSVPSTQPGKRQHLPCQLELWSICESQKNTKG